MRASTLFIFTATLLAGLAVAVGWRFYNARKVVEAPPRLETQILVASKNIFAGDMIDATGVRVRAVKPGESNHYEHNKQDYLPPVPAAAALRIAKVNIEADTPITRDLLKEMVKPALLNERLLPEMRATNLSLTKEHSAGGNIVVGEWVDVLLTSTISGGDGITTTKTATLVPASRVIAKRDTLWPVFAPLPKDKPVDFTLEVTAHKAALIEFARNKGTISIVPLPQSEQKRLEASRQEKLAAQKEHGDQGPVAVAPGGNGAAPEEEDEVTPAQATTAKSDPIVSDADLVRIFDLKVPQPVTEPPPPATWTVERYVGTRRVEAAVFTLDNQRVVPGSTPGFGNLNNASFGYPGSGGSYPYNWQRGGVGYNYTPWGQLVTGPGHPPVLGGAGINSRGNTVPTWQFNQPNCPTCKKNRS